MNNITISKNFYNSTNGFTAELEALDPSSKYTGTELEKLDAFQRQLKRFEIKVAGKGSDSISKFFQSSNSATLFPEYVKRAVKQGIDDLDVINRIIASETQIDTLDYRTIATAISTEDAQKLNIPEASAIPEISIRLKQNLVSLKKRGRMLSASYESIKFQRLNIFTVALKEIGSYIARTQLQDAVTVLINGDGNQNPAKEITANTAGTLTYEDLISLWNQFEAYQLNTILASPNMMAKIMTLTELRDPFAGIKFSETGKILTPFGAEIIKSTAVPENKIIGFDKRFAIEKVTASDVAVDYDKLIDTQLERATITSITGFSKIMPDAIKVLVC